jgi:hypothetical protein
MGGAIGTWEAPLPLRLGGASNERVRKIFDLLRANMGSAFSSDEVTPAANVAEDIAAARLLAWADRFVDLRINQWDPHKTTVMIERWEAILGVVPTQTDTDFERRIRIAARLLGRFSGTYSAILQIATESFAPWAVAIHTNTAASAVAWWPGGSPISDPLWASWGVTSWYSTILNVCVEYKRPIAATDAEVETRRQACLASLDEHLPAYCTYNVSETLDGSDFGFRIGESRLGYAALSST